MDQDQDLDLEIIQIEMGNDQWCPPIGAEVTLNRQDGTKKPCVFLAKKEVEDGKVIWYFRPVIEKDNG